MTLDDLKKPLRHLRAILCNTLHYAYKQLLDGDRAAVTGKCHFANRS